MTQFWRNSLLIGAALFLETCAFYLVFSIITGIIQLAEARIPFWLTFLALLWAFLLASYVQTVRFSLNLRGTLGLILSVISILILSNLSTGSGLIPFGKILSGDLVTAATEVISLIFLIVLWWRGSSIAHDDVTLDSIRGIFQWGLAVVFAAVVIDAIIPARVINGPIVMGFFGVGLLGMSMARFSSESGDSLGMTRDWFIPIGITVGGVLLLGLIISLIGVGGLDDATRAIFGFIGKIGLWILKPILLGLGYIAAGLVALGNWLVSVFGGGDLSGLEEAQRQIDQFHESLEREEQGQAPALLLMLLKWVAFLVAATLTGWVLYQLFRFRKLLRVTSEVEETRESLFSWQRVNQDLSSLLNEWWGNLVRAAGSEGRRVPEPRDPRELYHNFLALSQELGHPRQDGQTPKEHQHELGWTLPPEPVAHIVDGFQVVHYGHHTVDEQQMQRLLQDWAGIRQYLRERQQSAEDNSTDESREG
jgi:hypothetical protein